MGYTVDCPECEKEVEIPDEWRENNQVYEIEECPHCGKAFQYEVEYNPSFRSWKTPCLNGETHNYQPIIGWPEEYYCNRRRCEWCGDEIDVTDKKER